ncbi:MAG: hypothetical protein WC073_02400 [Sterolibacterium sp.]
MNSEHRIEPPLNVGESPPEGTRRIIAGQQRVLYDGYWIRTYPIPANVLGAKKNLIEALTRRLFNHTEHGLNIPGNRLAEIRQSYETETDPGRRRVKAAMLAGALFNRTTDIFKKLVELQADGIEIRSDNALMRECGRCLLEAMELGRFALHRSGEEGIDELWGEPFRAFSVPIEDYYESRYIKIGQTLRDIDRIAEAMMANFSRIAQFEGIESSIRDFAGAAKIKTETLRIDPDIFDVWAQLVAAGERLANFKPRSPAMAAGKRGRAKHDVSVGIQLLLNGRDLIYYITRARTPMPKSTREYIDRCETYRASGKVPSMPVPLPA